MSLPTLGAGPPSSARGGVSPPVIVTSIPVGQNGGQACPVHVFDVTNGWSLVEVQADVQNLAPASTVKLMTLLLMWEYRSGVWTQNAPAFTTADVTQPYPGLNLDSAGFLAGDVTTWESLAYAASLPSAFEPCYLAARVIGSDGNGTGGVAGFVTLMNARAAQLRFDTVKSVYFDPAGGSKTFSPDTVRNTITPRDLTRVLIAAMAIPAIRAITRTATKTINITGGRTTTLALSGTNFLANGPLGHEAGVAQPKYLGGKIGIWIITGQINVHSIAGLWQAPSGNEVSVVTMGSVSKWSLLLDQVRTYYQIPKLFDYLRTPGSPTDPGFANVKLLVGADGSVVDESPAARTLTVTSVTADGAPLVSVSTGSLVLDAVSDQVSAAFSAADAVGFGDLCDEAYIASTTIPGGGVERVPWIKHLAGNNRQVAVNYINLAFGMFASSDGANWNVAATMLNLDADGRGAETQKTLFNGAPTHLAMVKFGSSLYLYLCGVQLGVVSLASLANPNSPFTIGSGAGNTSWVGTIDEFRRTVGTPRYIDGQVDLTGEKFPRAGSPPPPP